MTHLGCAHGLPKILLPAAAVRPAQVRLLQVTIAQTATISGNQVCPLLGSRSMHITHIIELVDGGQPR
jgi:hypothetical protein